MDIVTLSLISWENNMTDNMTARNDKVIRRERQPLCNIPGVEPEVDVYDLLVQQQQIDEMEDFDTVDADELAEDIKKVLCETDPNMRRYLDTKPEEVSKFKIEYDNYPTPMRGPNNGVDVLVCFAKNWSKDWGGEIITFEECDPKDVIASYPGRIVVNKNEAWIKVSQPNVRAEEELKYLFFTLSN